MKGSVVKKGNKYYVVLYLGRKPDGTKDYKWYSGFNSQKEADDGLAELRKAAKDKTLVDNNSITVKEFLDLWIKDYVEPNLAANTADRSRFAVNCAEPVIGNIKIQKLEPYQIQQWVNKMNEGHLSKSSVRAYYSSIKSAFSKAVSWRIISMSPCVDITLPKEKKKAMNTLTASEVTKLLEQAGEHPFRLVLLLAASCGLRRGEILGLRWRQVDMQNQIMHLSENYTQSTKGIKLAELKSDSAYRAVNFGDAVKLALKEQRTRQMQALTSDNIVDITSIMEESLRDLHVCTWYDLRPFRPDFASTKCRELIEAAGITKIRFHDLRHTHATLLLIAGVHPKVVQERLGHAKITITLDRYSHVLPSMQKEASQLLNF